MSPAQLLRSREGGAYRARAFRPEDAMIVLFRRLLARYRAWRRRGQIWAHGQRMTHAEAAHDVNEANYW